MPINTLEFRTSYTEALDKAFVAESVSKIFVDNTMRSKFVGANTVIVTSANFAGLADYDRDTGFSRGAIDMSKESFTLAMDRQRSLQIDREDADETGIPEMAGRYGGEFIRTKVVPECDAYVLSKLAGIAKTKGHYVIGGLATPYATLTSLISSVRTVVGYDKELVAFVDSATMSAFENSTEISKMITVSDFKQGEVSFKVRKINGVSLVPVVPERMKSAYSFLNTSTGGFVPLDTAVGIHMIVMPCDSAHLVKKSEKVRVFTPDQNQTADAYKFDYRIYYDIFVKKSEIDSIYAAFAPSVSISSNVTATVSKTAGSITGSLSVTAAASDASTLEYQWYYADDASGNGLVPIYGATANSWTIDTTLKAGTYYVLCKITGGKSTVKNSNVCTLTVAAAG